MELSTPGKMQEGENPPPFTPASGEESTPMLRAVQRRDADQLWFEI
jgi:hypothetical protein